MLHRNLTPISGYSGNLFREVYLIDFEDSLVYDYEETLSIGFAKDKKTMDYMIPYFNKLALKIRKPRMMGSATLALTYVACGRFHGYIESKVNLWDIAAGGLILECAGGEFWRMPRRKGEHSYVVVATNGCIRKQIERVCGPLDLDSVLK